MQYEIDLSIFVDSIKISIDDQNYPKCCFLSMEINIEPSFTFDLDLIGSSIDNFITNYDSYFNIKGDPDTNFRTGWFKVNEQPLETTFDIFYSDYHGNIRECIINQTINYSPILPSWITDISSYFYHNINTSISFNDFLLSIIQLRITIWGDSSSNNPEIFQIGECLVKLTENQLSSNKNFLFINKIHEHSFVVKIDDIQTDNFTIGILRCFFKCDPRIKTVNCGSKNNNNNFKNTNIPIQEPRKKYSQVDNLNSSNTNFLSNEKYGIEHFDYIPLKWEYLDDYGKTRGPYSSIIIMSWILKGYFSDATKLRLFHVSNNNNNENERNIQLFKEFKPLNEHINLIKSDVSRLFFDSTKDKKHCTNQMIDLNRFNKNSPQRYNIYNPKSDKKDNIINKSRNIPIEVRSIREKLKKIEMELMNKMNKKFSENKKGVDNTFVLNSINNSVSERDKVIEYATRNVFKQKNNYTFKRWCAEFGPELVFEACAIRIQRAFRKHKKKKTINLH